MEASWDVYYLHPDYCFVYDSQVCDTSPPGTILTSQLSPLSFSLLLSLNPVRFNLSLYFCAQRKLTFRTMNLSFVFKVDSFPSGQIGTRWWARDRSGWYDNGTRARDRSGCYDNGTAGHMVVVTWPMIMVNNTVRSTLTRSHLYFALSVCFIILSLYRCGTRVWNICKLKPYFLLTDTWRVFSNAWANLNQP